VKYGLQLEWFLQSKVLKEQRFKLLTRVDLLMSVPKQKQYCIRFQCFDIIYLKFIGYIDSVIVVIHIHHLLKTILRLNEKG